MKKTCFVKAARKKARARCKVRKGAGNIHINNAPLYTKYTKYKRELIKEPLYLFPEEGSSLDFFINVKGGGVSAQAQTIRSCIAKAILKANNNKDSIRDKFMDYDRRILVDDVRQKEPVKQLGKGARAKKQHSKR